MVRVRDKVEVIIKAKIKARFSAREEQQIKGFNFYVHQFFSVDIGLYLG
jgi:hypothetical protein